MNASVNATNKTQNNVIDVQPSTPKTLKKIPRIPNKKAEFQAFLETLKTPNVKAHWQEIAAALGVGADTISEWQKLPEAVAAKQEGISRALEGMTMAGVADWKMYQAKLKMLNVKTNDEPSGGNVTNNNTLILLADALKAIASKPI